MPLVPEQIHRQVLEIATAQLSLSADEVARLNHDSDLSEHLDSMQRLTLVVSIEDHFKICFEPEDDEQATTLGDVTRIVHQRLAGA
jgi:acyl carrier protein